MPCDLRTWSDRHASMPRPRRLQLPSPGAAWRATVKNGTDCGGERHADRFAATHAALKNADVLLQPTLDSPFRDRIDALTRTPDGWVATLFTPTLQPDEKHTARFARALVPFVAALGPVRATLVHIHRSADSASPPETRWFKSIDVTGAVASALPAATAEAARVRALLSATTPPTVAMGAHCAADPCPYFQRCAAIPNATPPPPEARDLVTEETITKARAKFAALPKPWGWFDIERVMPGLPLRADDKPYTNIPSQWALLVDDGVRTTQHTYLADRLDEAEHKFIGSFLEATEGVETIFVWSNFERTALNSLAERFPHHRAALQSRVGRVVDALKLVQAFRPGRKTSLKLVAKAVLPVDPYRDLHVQDGQFASDLTLVALDPATPAEQREQLRKDLIAYNLCDVTTMASVVATLCGGEAP